MLKQGKMQQMKRNQRNALTRRELADVRHAVSKRNCTWLHFEKCTWRMRCVLVSLFSRCARIGPNAGPTQRKWKIKTEKELPIIPDGVCQRRNFFTKNEGSPLQATKQPTPIRE